MAVEVARRWLIDTDGEMDVIATDDAVLVTAPGGLSIRFTPAAAMALGEVLTDAAEVAARYGWQWRGNLDLPALRKSGHEGSPFDPEEDQVLEELRAKLAAVPPRVDETAEMRNVVLHNAGDRKIGVIKVLREHAYDHDEKFLPLRTAKDMVDAKHPSAVAIGLDIDHALELAGRLRDAGAEVAVVPFSAG